MPPPDDQPAPSRVRRSVAFLAIAVAVILLLLFTPPLLNVNGYRRRIAQTLSDNLGRPVHIDDVKLHLLPMPSLELRNVVVSEDPAFGAEPTIRANRVIAVLRASSLWRRRVEFGTVRFVADENGVGPSVNLVRNAAGRWNLDSVLMQAAHTSVAPTAQRRAGPVPRFPYIEAQAARVNLKLGDEKMPFSLTDAEFALWLPDPGEWHVRLKGQPMRTDANVSETGTVQLEGTLRRAAGMAQVPVDLQATWTGAQLGEATTLLTGRDMGWRGSLTVDAALRGPLGSAVLHSHVGLHDLRRAEFVPTHMLEVDMTCAARATVTAATLQDAACHLPAPLPGAADNTGGVELRAAGFDLTSREASGLTLDLRAANAWLLDWARLLSPAIPAGENPSGMTEGTLTHIPAAASQPGFWNGQLQGAITGTLPWIATGAPSSYPFLLQASPSGLNLQPVNVSGPGESPLSLHGTFNRTGYTLALDGVTNPSHVSQLAQLLPAFAGGLAAVLPAPGTFTAGPQRVDIECGRAWSAPEQTCTADLPSMAGSSRARPSVRRKR